MQKIESHKCFGGTLSVWEHQSSSLNSTMKFSIFLPQEAAEKNHTPDILAYKAG